MKCEIAGCEEVATHRINGIGNACSSCMKKICMDLKIEEDDDAEVRSI